MFQVRKILFFILLISLSCHKTENKPFVVLQNPTAIKALIPESPLSFSLEGGTYYGEQELSLRINSDGTENGKIFYKLQKVYSVYKEDAEDFIEYSQAIKLKPSNSIIYVLKAYLNINGHRTETLQKTYSVRNKVLSPVMYPPGGTFLKAQNLRFESPTEGAIIRYSFGSVKPDMENGIIYKGESIFVESNTLVSAVAYFENNPGSISSIKEELYSFVKELPQPVFSLKEGEYKESKLLFISPPVSSASVRYTLDGTEPTREQGILIDPNSQYENNSNEIYLNQNYYIRAIAFTEDEISKVKDFRFILKVPDEPKLSLSEGTYTGKQVILINVVEDDVDVYYTTNSNLPRIQAEYLYREAIEISNSLTLRAMACYKNTQNCSSTVIRNYVIEGTLSQPVLFPPAGDYDVPGEIQFIDIESGSQIYYTLDGTEPKPGESLLYISPIVFDKTLHLRAVAYKPGYSLSSEVSGFYNYRAFRLEDIQKLYANANLEYGQKAGEGLTSEVLRAIELVQTHPSLIQDLNKRQKFVEQNAALAASELCTSIVRYLYLKAYSKIYPERILNLPPGFAEFYIYGVDKGYIITDSGGQTFNWVLKGTELVKGFLNEIYYNSWDKYRYEEGYNTDAALLDYANSSEKQIFFLRDGPDVNTASHTFLAIKHPTDGFKMLDTYHHPWTGKGFYENAASGGIYKVRFGPSGTRWLHIVYSYTKN